ncbi:MLP-like protein 423 [Malus sylvestris]|uniref:MLP-like protein 423 n=1 Tax=Malus sylvestris TaxID=3752 RepID=UPI0021ACD122|nr:MLP-like protein 423 [Malus sylvestris]
MEATSLSTTPAQIVGGSRRSITSVYSGFRRVPGPYMDPPVILLCSALVKVSKETIDAVDEVGKAVAYKVIDGDLLKYYKSFKCTLTVTPKGDGSLVKWSSVYEKANEQVPEPSIIKDFAAKNFLELDAYVLAN